jgi:crotonobetainyl-CoA:carnitine CoA-transferase CaiB-like acyl-CoA transferase
LISSVQHGWRSGRAGGAPGPGEVEDLPWPLEVIEHPHLAARVRWREVATPAGPVVGALPPLIFNGEELPMGPVPGLGEHTEAVLAELGIDPSSF